MSKLPLKTTLAVCFCFVFSVPVFAKTTLNLWYSSFETSPLWQKLEQDFNSTHKNIKLQSKAFDHEEMKHAVLTSGFKRKSADILLMPSDWLGYNNMMEFSIIPENIIHPEVSISTIEESSVNGFLRGIPFFKGNHLLFMYNKSLVSQPVTTWAALLASKKELAQQNVTPLAIVYNEMYWLVPFIDAFGGEFLHQEKALLDTQATVAALKYYKQLAQLKVVNRNCSYQCITTDFYNGKYAYAISGAWAYQEAKEALGKNFGLALFPSLQGHEFSSLRANLIFTFPKNTFHGVKNEALIEFSRFIQQEKYQQLIFEQSGLLPVNEKVMTKILSHADDDFQLLVKQFQRSNSTPASTSVAAAWNGMSKGFSLYMNGEISASQAAKYMQKTVDREREILNRKLH
ncbi:MAG: extracellular solute-binding protein [Colwellia sp.]